MKMKTSSRCNRKLFEQIYRIFVFVLLNFSIDCSHFNCWFTFALHSEKKNPQQQQTIPSNHNKNRVAEKNTTTRISIMCWSVSEHIINLLITCLVSFPPVCGKRSSKPAHANVYYIPFTFTAGKISTFCWNKPNAILLSSHTNCAHILCTTHLNCRCISRIFSHALYKYSNFSIDAHTHTQWLECYWSAKKIIWRTSPWKMIDYHLFIIHLSESTSVSSLCVCVYRVSGVRNV